MIIQLVLTCVSLESKVCALALMYSASQISHSYLSPKVLKLSVTAQACEPLILLTKSTFPTGMGCHHIQSLSKLDAAWVHTPEPFPRDGHSSVIISSTDWRVSPWEVSLGTVWKFRG